MLFKGREYYLAAILIIVISIFLFMWSFEKRKPKTREVVVLAVMTSIATLGRVMFFMLPQFKPCVAIIIITGIMLGKQAGFLCGALTAFVSDFSGLDEVSATTRLSFVSCGPSVMGPNGLWRRGRSG